jgi:hypothetical protein
MSINTLINNSFVLDELAGAIPPYLNTLNPLNLQSLTLTGIGDPYERAALSITSNVQAFIHIDLTNNTPGGKSYGIYCNGENSLQAGTLDFYNNSSNTAIMTFNDNNVGINNLTPKSKFSVVGLNEYLNNAAAVAGGLAVGDFYYTTDGTDGILKIVI